MSDLLSPADQHIRHSHCSSQFKPPTHSQSVIIYFIKQCYTLNTKRFETINIDAFYIFQMVLIGMNPAEDCLLAAQQRGKLLFRNHFSSVINPTLTIPFAYCRYAVLGDTSLKATL